MTNPEAFPFDPGHNLFAALRRAFPADLDAPAIELPPRETGEPPRCYSWRDVDRATAMMANWLGSLGLADGARLLVHVGESVEAALLFLAVLRGGWVHVPIAQARRPDELGHFIQATRPSALVCGGRDFGWASKLAFTSGVRHVFTLNGDRTGTLLDRASFQSDQHAPAAKAAADPAALLLLSGGDGEVRVLSHGDLLGRIARWDWRDGLAALIGQLPVRAA